MPEPATQLPLETSWVERSFTLHVEGQPIDGTARANWGALEVTLTAPLLGR